MGIAGTLCQDSAGTHRQGGLNAPGICEGKERRAPERLMDHGDPSGDWGWDRQSPVSAALTSSPGDSGAGGGVPSLIQRNICLPHPLPSRFKPTSRGNHSTATFKASIYNLDIEVNFLICYIMFSNSTYPWQKKNKLINHLRNKIETTV